MIHERANKKNNKKNEIGFRVTLYRGGKPTSPLLFLVLLTFCHSSLPDCYFPFFKKPRKSKKKKNQCLPCLSFFFYLASSLPFSNRSNQPPLLSFFFFSFGQLRGQPSALKALSNFYRAKRMSLFSRFLSPL